MMRNGNLVDVKWKPRNVTITTPKNTLGKGLIVGDLVPQEFRSHLTQRLGAVRPI